MEASRAARSTGCTERSGGQVQQRNFMSHSSGCALAKPAMPYHRSKDGKSNFVRRDGTQIKPGRRLNGIKPILGGA